MIYLDHNASTPVIPAAREAVLRALEIFGNPSSHHAPGRAARAIVEKAREAVAASIGARPPEIVFTSGGTEAAALGIAGLARAAGVRRAVTSPVEHRAVLEAAARFEVVLARPDPSGRTSPEALREALGSAGGAIVAIASASNEIGTKNDVAALAAVARERGARLFCDAVQSYGKEPLDVRALGADAVALSAHKIGGPKGAGALWIRPGVTIEPFFRGGPQEGGRRAGTENVPGIAGFGAAAAAIGERLAAAPRIRALRDRLREAILGALPPGAAIESGDREGGLGNTLHLCFREIDGDALRIALDLEGIAVSGGAACASGATEPSHVLLALGLSREEARAAIRFSLGIETAEAEIDAAAEAVVRHVKRMRARAARPASFSTDSVRG
jgi:cysteine desulfurase